MRFVIFYLIAFFFKASPPPHLFFFVCVYLHRFRLSALNLWVCGGGGGGGRKSTNSKRTRDLVFFGDIYVLLIRRTEGEKKCIVMCSDRRTKDRRWINDQFHSPRFFFFFLNVRRRRKTYVIAVATNTDVRRIVEDKSCRLLHIRFPQLWHLLSRRE